MIIKTHLLWRRIFRTPNTKDLKLDFIITHNPSSAEIPEISLIDCYGQHWPAQWWGRILSNAGEGDQEHGGEKS
jgi:hypothetical protein